MTFDLVSAVIGFVPSALAAGAYAFTHNAKLTAIATKVDTAVNTVTSAAAAIKAKV